MEIIINILEFAPKTHILKLKPADLISIIFTINNQSNEISDIEKAIKNKESLTIITKESIKLENITFTVKRNKDEVIGTGQLLSINDSKWYNINQNDILSDRSVSFKIKLDITVKNKKQEKHNNKTSIKNKKAEPTLNLKSSRKSEEKSDYKEMTMTEPSLNNNQGIKKKQNLKSSIISGNKNLKDVNRNEKINNEYCLLKSNNTSFKIKKLKQFDTKTGKLINNKVDEKFTKLHTAMISFSKDFYKKEQLNTESKNKKTIKITKNNKTEDNIIDENYKDNLQKDKSLKNNNSDKSISTNSVNRSSYSLSGKVFYETPYNNTNEFGSKFISNFNESNNIYLSRPSLQKFSEKNISHINNINEIDKFKSGIKNLMSFYDKENKIDLLANEYVQDFENLKSDFFIFYTDEYIEKINEDMYSLEVLLMIDKAFELQLAHQKAYSSSQINNKELEKENNNLIKRISIIKKKENKLHFKINEPAPKNDKKDEIIPKIDIIKFHKEININFWKDLLNNSNNNNNKETLNNIKKCKINPKKFLEDIFINICTKNKKKLDILSNKFYQNLKKTRTKHRIYKSVSDEVYNTNTEYNYLVSPRKKKVTVSNTEAECKANTKKRKSAASNDKLKTMKSKNGDFKTPVTKKKGKKILSYK